MKTTRSEHLEWCKQRALEYCDLGDVNNASISMISDMEKNDETKNHSALKVMVLMMMAGHLSSPEEMRKFILGFN